MYGKEAQTVQFLQKMYEEQNTAYLLESFINIVHALT